MTNEEAIEVIEKESMRLHALPIEEDYGKHKKRVAFRKAIEALKKQIPKKMGCVEDKYLHCPVCDEPIDYKWAKYPNELNHFEWLRFCWNCGQAVDTDEVE